MKSIALTSVIGVASLLLGCFGQSSSVTIPAPQPNVYRMKTVPDGHFLANLEIEGTEQLVNVRVQNNVARSVNSSDSRFLGLTGQFQLIGNGVFIIGLQGDNYQGTQFWVFKQDGTAEVKEVPDRGEMQLAIPVDDDSLEQPL